MQDLSIRKFTDYRAFLVAYAQDRKRQDTRWTYGTWARRLGLKSTSSITKVIHGDRHPGDQLVAQLARYFRFTPKEEDYFKDLVRLRKIQNDPRLSVLLMEKMGKDHPNGALRIMDEKTFAVISNWYCLPLRELVRQPRFRENADELSKKFRFKVTPRELTQAIENLLATGLLVRDKKGLLQVAEGRVSTQNDVASEALKRFHEQMLDHAKTALRAVDPHEREITASTLLIRSENMPKAKELIREFKSRFARLMEETEGDQVYQIQIQLFPVTKKEIQK